MWQDILKKKGLWANIHAKRKRGEQPAKEGDEDYPDASSWQKVTKKKPNKGKRFVSKKGTSYGQAGNAKLSMISDLWFLSPVSGLTK